MIVFKINILEKKWRMLKFIEKRREFCEEVLCSEKRLEYFEMIKSL